VSHDRVGRTYEFRVVGRLSGHALQAFAGMDVTEVPAKTIMCISMADDGEVHATLALIESLGLQLLSMDRVT
jgi:hypothetical protein